MPDTPGDHVPRAREGLMSPFWDTIFLSGLEITVRLFWKETKAVQEGPEVRLFLMMDMIMAE